MFGVPPPSNAVLEYAVDASRETGDDTVPLEGDRVAPAEHLSSLVVDENELKLGKLRVEPVPVLVGDVAVLQELGPDAIEAQGPIQIRSLGERDDCRRHGPIVPGREAVCTDCRTEGRRVAAFRRARAHGKFCVSGKNSTAHERPGRSGACLEEEVRWKAPLRSSQ